MTINKQEWSSDNSTWFAQGWNATIDMITYWFSSPSNLNKNNEFFPFSSSNTSMFTQLLNSAWTTASKIIMRFFGEKVMTDGKSLKLASKDEQETFEYIN